MKKLLSVFIALTLLLLLCSCGKAGETVYGGNSSVHDPWGETVVKAGDAEEIITAECDMEIISGIRSSINVFNDRRPALYKTDK